MIDSNDFLTRDLFLIKKKRGRGRPRQYKDNAEKQRAYRLRKKLKGL